MAIELQGSLALDAMGGDKGPAEFIKGLSEALKQLEGDQVTGPMLLVGDNGILKSELEKVGLAGDSRVSVVHAEEVISMDEKPMNALKKKKKSSMMIALDLVREGSAKAIMSCGNTGALMGGGTIKVRPLDGVERPALGTIIPGLNKFSVLIDSGANPETTPKQMVHNAILGSNYAKVVLGIENPRVGLLTIGTEEGKGGEKIQSTHELLKSSGDVIRYEGLVEGFHLFDGEAEVIVCDGFVGNVVLKSCESLFHVFRHYLKKELSANPVRMFGAALAQGAFKDIKDHFNPAEYGAAPFLGLKAPVFKAHGSSDASAIAGGIKIAMNVLKHDMNENILRDVTQVNDLLDRPAVA